MVILIMRLWPVEIFIDEKNIFRVLAQTGTLIIPATVQWLPMIDYHRMN